MNIRKLLKSFFTEKRLLNMALESGDGKAPVEGPKTKLDTPQKLDEAKQKLLTGKVEQRQQTDTPALKTKNPKTAAITKYLENLDNKKFAEIMNTGSVMVDVAGKKEVENTSAFTRDQIDLIVEYAVKTPKDLKTFVDKLATEITPKSISIGDLSDKSITALINALKTKPAELEPLLDKLLSASGPADMTIANIEKAFKSDKGMIDSMIKIILKKKDLIKKLSPTSLATLINSTGLGDKRIFDKLDGRQKSALLFTQLKPELKINIFDKLIKDGLASLDFIALENLVLFAYANPDQLKVLIGEFVKTPKLIEKIGLAGCIKLLRETFGKKGQEKLQGLLLANISGANKLSIYNINSIPVAIRMAIWENFSIDMKKKYKKPKTADEMRKENKDLLKKESAEYLKKHKTGEQKIASVPGLSIVGRDIVFNIAGVKRSFKKSPTFLKELAKPEYDSRLKVKLACYKRLLTVIIDDKSYTKGAKYNWHKIASNKQYAASNAELDASIAKFSATIADLDKGEQAPDKRTMAGKVTPTPTAPAATAAQPGVKPEAPAATDKKAPVGTPEKVHNDILESLKQQGIKIILPAGTKLPLLSENNIFDGLKNPVSKIQQAIINGKDLEKLAKVLKEQGQKVKDYFEKVLKLKGVKIEITINVTKKLKGKETKVIKTFMWDQGNPENGGFGKISADWLLGNKGETVYAGAPDLKEKPKAPAKPAAKPAKAQPAAATATATTTAQPGTTPVKTGKKAPVKKPKMVKGAVFSKPAKAKEYSTEAELHKEMLKGMKEVVDRIKNTLNSKYTGICKSLELKKAPNKKGEKLFKLVINGKETSMVITIAPTKKGAKFTPSISAGGATFNSAEKAEKKIEDFTAGLLEIGHRSYETKEKSRKDLLDRLQNNANKAIEEYSGWVSKNLGTDVKQKITLKKKGSDGDYTIMVDGKESPLSLHITTVKNRYRNGFVSSHFTIGDLVSTHANSTFAKHKFINALRSVANTRVLDKDAQGKAVKDLEHNGLSFPKGVDVPKLSVEKYKILLESAIKVEKTILDGTNVYEIAKTMKKIGKRMAKLGFPSTVKIKFSISAGGKTHELTWDSKAEIGGFDTSKAAIIIKINKIKAAQFAGKSTLLTRFKRQSDMKRLMADTAGSRESNKEFEMKDWSNAVKNSYYKIDPSVADLDDADISRFWERFDGYREVNSILGSPPFNVPGRLQSTLGTKIIAGEGLTNKNKFADFEDIFIFMHEYNGGFKGIPKNIIQPKFLKSDTTFLKHLNRLKTENPAYHKILVEKVLKPCLLLLRAMTKLKYTHKPKTERTRWSYARAKRVEAALFDDPSTVAIKSYPKGQHHIIKGLQSLLGYKEHEKGAGKAALAWLAGGKGRTDQIYMSDMNGKVKKIDEGMFQRHFNPRAALFMLLEQKGLYKLDPESGKKTIDEKAMLAEVNKMLKNGYLQKALRKFNMKGKKPTPKEIKAILAKIDSDLSQYQISSFKDLDKLKGKHKLAFQLGFIQMQVEKIDDAKEKALDARVNAAFEADGKDPSKMSAGERALMRKLKQKGLKTKLLPEVYTAISKSIGGAGILFDSEGKFMGAGIGSGVKLSDGSMFVWGAGFTSVPPYLTAQIGFNFKIYQANGHNINFNTSVGITGIHAAISGKHDVGKGVDLTWLAGIGFGFKGLMDVAGTGGGIEWGRAISKGEVSRGYKKISKKAGWSVENIKNWKSHSPAKKMAILQSLPQWDAIKAIIAKSPQHFTKKYLLKTYDRYFSSLSADALHKASSGWANIPFVPTGISAGVASIGAVAAAASGPGAPVLAAIAVIGGIKFRLGTVVMFIPSPGEAERVLNASSSTRVDARVRAKLKKIAKEMADGTFTPAEFSEESGAIYRKPGGKIGVRIGEAQIVNLSGLSKLAAVRGQRGLAEHNKALRPAEVKLIKHDNGKIELSIQNLYNKDGQADKDLEIHIDPMLKKLGATIENGKVFLDGNLDDLIITRERFMFSSQKGEGKSSIRDVITIRQRASFEGKIKADRDWITKHEASFAEILMGHKKMRVRRGIGGVGIPNIRGENYPKALKEKWMAKLKKVRTETISARKTGPSHSPAEIKEIRKDVDGMWKALKSRTNKDWEKMILRPKFYEEMRALYNNKEFKKKFREITDNPEKIYKLLQDFEANGTIKPKMNEREYTMAENYLRNMWFVTAYRSYGDLRRLRISKEGKASGLTLTITKKLWKAGLYNMTSLDKISADEIVAKSKGKISRKEADIVIKAMQEFKNRELTDTQLKWKNKLVLKNLLKFKRWTEKKYVQDFDAKIKKIWKTGPKPNAKALVAKFMDGIYGGLIKDLKNTTPPIKDFRRRELVGIPQGSTLVSGSRTEKGRKSKEYRAFTNTLSYESTDKDAVQIHGYGFLEGTSVQYSLSKGTKEEKQIARILLEIAHPMPEKKEDVLKSALAIQVLSLASYRLIAGAKNYKAMTEIVKDPKLATSTDKKYSDAMDQLMQLLKDIRASQHAGKPYVHAEKIKGVTVTMDFTSGTVIKSGAFTKCTNASFFVDMKAKARLSTKHRQTKPAVIGDFVSSRQKRESIVGRDEVGLSLFGGVYHTFKGKPVEEKVASHGGSQNPPEGDKPSGHGGASGVGVEGHKTQGGTAHHGVGDKNH